MSIFNSSLLNSMILFVITSYSIHYTKLYEGRGDKAYKLYKQTAPAFMEKFSEIHKTEPYVYSQMVSGKDAYIQGEAKNSWLTGAAAWNYVAVTQHILGVRPTFDGLQIDPVITSYSIHYTKLYEFHSVFPDAHVLLQPFPIPLVCMGQSEARQM